MTRAGSREHAALVSVRGLGHIYGSAGDSVRALRHVDLDLAPGERVAVTGRSGSGKTTLLNVLAGLERPSSGQVVIGGIDLGRSGRREREAHRRSVVGYVWQQPEDGLLPGLTAMQNVLVPMLANGRSRADRSDLALHLLDVMRLGDRLHELAARLSPLETQRLALTAALANRPRLLLADELTAGLDWAAARELLGDLSSALDESGAAAVLVTHDRAVASYVDRMLLISDGVLVPAPGEPGARAARATR